MTENESSDARERESAQEHLAAIEVFRHAKNAFLWLVLFAIALHVVAWTWYVDPSSVETTIADRAFGDPVQLTPVGTALAWAGFIGRASLLVLTAVFVVTLLVSLSARLGGAAALARACVWSLAALAMCVPWISAAGVASGFSGYDSMVAEAGAQAGGTPFLRFVKFVLCPFLMAAFAVASQMGFRSAYRQMSAAPSARLPIQEL